MVLAIMKQILRLPLAKSSQDHLNNSTRKNPQQTKPKQQSHPLKKPSGRNISYLLPDAPRLGGLFCPSCFLLFVRSPASYALPALSPSQPRSTCPVAPRSHDRGCEVGFLPWMNVTVRDRPAPLSGSLSFCSQTCRVQAGEGGSYVPAAFCVF